MENEKKSKKSLNVPPLRFPEFDGEWIEIKLNDISKWGSGGTPSKEKSEYWNGHIPWISASSMRGVIYTDSLQKLTNEGLKNGSRIAEKGTILILVRGSMLFNKIPIGIAGIDLAFNQDVKSIKILEPNDSNFILFNLLSKEPQIMNLVSGTGIGAGKIDTDDLKCLKLSIPTITEQKKIAHFINQIEQRIETQIKIIEEFGLFKKGILQQIFSIKNIEIKNWQQKKLGEIAKIQTGSSNREDSILDGEFTFFDRSQEIRTSNRYLFDCEVIIVPGEGKEFVPKYFVGKFDLHQRTYAITQFSENISGLFLYYYISYNTSHLHANAVGSTVKSLRLPMFESMPISIPNIKEQQKISQLLNSLDQMINSEKQILEYYYQKKKYLLQQMFI